MKEAKQKNTKGKLDQKNGVDTSISNRDPHPAFKSSFDEASLPLAIGKLFELNNYSVEYGLHIHGAEVDVVATPKGTPYPQTVYIEATIQYVDNTKYGKDLSKFSLIRELDPGARCVLISSRGFTPDVKERALKTRIITQTYHEAFREFEKFSPYVDSVLESPIVNSLVASYEEPYFEDAFGRQLATSWLTDWRSDFRPNSRWYVILGEYGTGKTSLTVTLQHRWLTDYKNNPECLIPVRIELKNFSRQFDARSLLHHFLDNNRLSHVPIEFMLHLIRSGRVILILDGYDEMAQFLNARERRACLSALAELSAEGARGMLTSRPNYFTITEELTVFDALYTSLERNKYHLSQMDKLFLAEERSIDNLVENYVLSRQERYLRDLDQTQTMSLVQRKLSNDSAGQKLILDLLNRIFRDEIVGAKQSLGGKPVIISFLLEIIDDLKEDPTSRQVHEFTEWQVYKLIVDKLMIRDFYRTPNLDPERRRLGLQMLALTLSGRAVTVADEETFLEIIDVVCSTEIRRLPSPEERRSRRDELFQNFRSSATLTRSESGNRGWHFSHNSLREYLVAEFLVGRAVLKLPPPPTIPVSTAMRTFVASLSADSRGDFLGAIRTLWPNRSSVSIDLYFSIAWDLLRRSENGILGELRLLDGSEKSETANLNFVAVDRIELSKTELNSSKVKFNLSKSTLAESVIRELDLTGSTFQDSILDRVVISGCVLDECDFRSCLIFECELLDVSLKNADFRFVDPDINFVVVPEPGMIRALSGATAIGFLRFHGAITDDVDPYFVYQNHPKFPIVMKICENIQSQRNSQFRGLTQRGVAQADPNFARAFVRHLERSGLIEVDKKVLVSSTPEGRRQLPLFVGQRGLPKQIEEFLSTWN